MSRLLLRFLRDESGATAVEYAVMLALIIGVCVGAVMVLGTSTNDSFSNSRDSIVNAMAP